MAHKITVRDVADPLQQIHVLERISTTSGKCVSLKFSPFDKAYLIIEYDGDGGCEVEEIYAMRKAIKYFNELIGEDNDKS